MSILITKANGEKIPDKYNIYQVFPTSGKDTYPNIDRVGEKVKRLYGIPELRDYYPTFLLANKHKKEGVSVLSSDRPIICIETNSHCGIGVFHKRQLEMFSEQIFGEIFKMLNNKEDIKVTLFVHPNHKWSINPFVGKIFSSTNMVKCYEAVEIEMDSSSEIVVY